MFIYNFKINSKSFFKYFIIIIVALAIISLIISIVKIVVKEKKQIKDSDYITINSNEYSNFLKDCHSNIDAYVGKKYCITGYVYRMPDFNKNQFVLARNMLLYSNNKSVVVGILSENNKASSFENGTYVVCKGVIEKGDYHGDMPVFKITSIEKCEKPDEDFINPPSD